MAAKRNLPAGGESARAQMMNPAPQNSTSELETTLFVQDPHLPAGKKGLLVIWIPQPIQKVCMGKSAKECSTIDYCIRTTSKQVSMCQNLGVDITHFPPYPPSIPPRRLLSITYFIPMQGGKGFDSLVKFFERAPKGSLDRLSTKARIKAKIKLTRTEDDDQFDLEEVLAVPPG